MKVRRFSDSLTLSSEVAGLVAGVLAEKNTRPFGVMLSGGQTPMPAYQRLAAQRVIVDAHAHVLFSDERVVPSSSPDSNYGRIRPVLAALRVPDDRVLRVQADLGLPRAAEQYDADLKKFLAKGALLRLGLLGLGADGHTASLFSLTDVQRGRGLMAIPVVRSVKPDRVSVTATLIEKMDLVVILASGPDKKLIIDRMVREPMSLPAGQAVAQARNVELWVC
ncbi:MAG: 6-phosphogluconolactonase [Verrucomicrobia bacterium ADurb.Bin345]|nr:MAG: 6-phosphogluconolactonase [Verrucomicrobia bacterium ADurb.Bin345]